MKVTCEYCESVVDAEKNDTCPNCGAGVICDSLTASTRCHFCHTPVILTGRLSGEFKPFGWDLDREGLDPEFLRILEESYSE